MRKNFLLLFLMTLLPLAGWSQTYLTGTTQYDTDGFKYLILSCENSTTGSTVEVSQNVYATNGAAAMVIKDEVTLNVKGLNDASTAIDKAVTFKVTSIADNGFEDVTKATSVVIGENINHIGANAFDGCTALASITFKDNANDVDIEDDAFMGTIFTSLDLTPLTGLVDVNEWFDSSYAPGTGDIAGTAVNSYLTTVSFPGSIQTIEACAFGGCEALTTVVFPETTLASGDVLTIGTGAFHGTAIAELDLTEAKIVTLEKLFENDNVTLTKVTMPESSVFTTLAASALANCIQLKTVDFSLATGLTTLNNYCLSNTIINTLDFTNNVALTTLPAQPFVNTTTTTNKNLKTVILPWDDENDYCPITAISTAFANCEKLSTITNLETSLITTIDDGAFAECISLSALTLPSTLNNVNGEPFDGCDILETLTFKGDTDVQIGDGTNALFGSDPVALDALKTLVIKGEYSGTIKAAALNTCTSLSSVTISDGDEFSGTIESGSIKLAEDANATLVFGDVTGTINTITGPVGIYKSTLTMAQFDPASTPSAAFVSGIIDVATISGTVDDNGVLTALGQVEKIIFDDDITLALSAPGTANAVLTAIEFNGDFVDAADQIPATAFDLTYAPILASVKYVPSTAPTNQIFNIAAFASVAQGAAAKVELTTSYDFAALYGASESNLYNVIFKYTDPDPTTQTLTVYGDGTSTYYYGKLALDASDRFAFPKETANGEQVIVYSAFVDDSDNTIYMDPLAIEDGYYVTDAVTAGTYSTNAVIVRMKNPQTTTEESVGYSAEIEYYNVGTTLASTMRYTSGSTTPFNDLEYSTQLYSSDFIGTNFYGKTLYAMGNPAKEGKLVWKKVSVDSYLPKNSIFVQTNETVSAPGELSVVWLDGEQDATGIIERMTEKAGNNDGAIYNLQGVRVSGAQKGIYIKNGKKFIVK